MSELSPFSEREDNLYLPDINNNERNGEGMVNYDTCISFILSLTSKGTPKA